MSHIRGYHLTDQQVQNVEDLIVKTSFAGQVPDHIYSQVNKWMNEAPLAHRSAYENVAHQILSAWENPQNDALRILNASITSLPPIPPHLKHLDLSFCGRLHAPPNLTDCKKLEEVNFTHCDQLSALPDLKHCKELKQLTFKGCTKLSNVDALAECLSARVVNLWGCIQVTSLPDLSKCVNLERLNLVHVPLTGLRENFFALSRECHVNLNASCMSVRLRELLSSIVNAPEYSGPQINFHMGEIDGIEELTLGEEVESWLAENDDAEMIDTSFWEKLQSCKETQASQFSQFLGRIRETSEYKMDRLRSELVRRVVDLLRHIEKPENESLRNTCFLIAEDAIGTCGDRIALSLMQMEMAMIGHQTERDVESGAYDNNVASLVTLGKGMFRMTMLSDIARKKADTLRFVDEIEVHLGYLIALSAKFQLPVQMKTMLYPKCSEITRRDLDEAVVRLDNFSDQDNLDWKAFLASWTPMEKQLRRELGERASDVQEDQIAAMMSVERNRLYTTLDRLDQEDQNYVVDAKSLMVEYNNLPLEIAVRVKEKKMASLLARLNIKW